MYLALVEEVARADSWRAEEADPSEDRDVALASKVHIPRQYETTVPSVTAPA